MPALRLLRLSLSQFRSYARLTWQPAGRIVVIAGANGSGKTNLLEAISLLVPGRGLRGARIGDLVRRGATAWAVNGRFATPEGPVEIATGTPPDGPADRRVFRLDGVAPRSQAELAAHAAAVWLTPQMDRLFQEGPSGRRRFLDRLTFALEPGHAREVAAFDTAMAQRNRLLAERRDDRAWLAGLEESMARHAVAATAARMGLVARLNATPAGAFPQARMALLCPIAARLAERPALEVEDWLRGALEAGRGADAASGSSALGAHRADMGLEDAASGLPAALASTGQQKALLIGVVLAHAALLAEARGAAPLLLLDEPVVHLDAGRRAALFAALVAGPAQCFMTGTDSDVFAPLRGVAEGVRTGDEGLDADPAFPAPGA
ncbi:MAG: DNA replication/repair protein RecF [Rhodospirillales bacterium 70-18]|nr:DNA replication/repair protein RecF [Rhodospirillales bacterium]OJY74300.1 MAG: DNA replication/repair protein RecF [Rhodospirillales bacterium 70-18]